jgi:hypothetical protein
LTVSLISKLSATSNISSEIPTSRDDVTQSSSIQATTGERQIISHYIYKISFFLNVIILSQKKLPLILQVAQAELIPQQQLKAFAVESYKQNLTTAFVDLKVPLKPSSPKFKKKKINKKHLNIINKNVHSLHQRF